MRILLSIFLLFTMVSNVAVSLMQQTQYSIVCEFEESQSDDDAKDAEEKESKTEKDLIAYKNHMSMAIDNLNTYLLTKHNIHIREENLLSALYKFLPENPPEL